MASYSNSPAVSAQIQVESSAADTTIYTVPANSYLLCNVYVEGTGGGIRTGATGFILKTLNANATTYTGVVVGPGAAISTLSAAVPVKIIGVLFTNQA